MKKEERVCEWVKKHDMRLTLSPSLTDKHGKRLLWLGRSLFSMLLSFYTRATSFSDWLAPFYFIFSFLVIFAKSFLFRGWEMGIHWTVAWAYSASLFLGTYKINFKRIILVNREFWILNSEFWFGVCVINQLSRPWALWSFFEFGPHYMNVC